MYELPEHPKASALWSSAKRNRILGLWLERAEEEIPPKRVATPRNKVIREVIGLFLKL
jgi:hypothetical protein